ncbi:MAG: biotin--[acetyl-CoA-carboxylase] ligase [Halobacteriaceae archaeon]
MTIDDLRTISTLDRPYRVEIHERVTSTNDIAVSLAQRGRRQFVIVADRQGEGHGRHGSGWSSPSGGIWCSAILSPTLKRRRWGIYSIAGGVAICEALRDRGIDAHLKWPNDVLVGTGENRGGEKIAGVLAKTGDGWIVMGMGVNANVSREELPNGATSIQEMSGPIDRSELVVALLDRLYGDVEPDDVLDRWRELTSTLDREVRLKVDDEVITATAVDVGPDGALLIDRDGKRKAVRAGDCEYLRID